eukprot:8040134-Prorocentrum_lima.AAC.1
MTGSIPPGHPTRVVQHAERTGDATNPYEGTQLPTPLPVAQPGMTPEAMPGATPPTPSGAKEEEEVGDPEDDPQLPARKR